MYAVSEWERVLGWREVRGACRDESEEKLSADCCRRFAPLRV